MRDCHLLDLNISPKNWVPVCIDLFFFFRPTIARAARRDIWVVLEILLNTTPSGCQLMWAMKRDELTHSITRAAASSNRPGGLWVSGMMDSIPRTASTTGSSSLRHSKDWPCQVNFYPNDGMVIPEGWVLMTSTSYSESLSTRHDLTVNTYYFHPSLVLWDLENCHGKFFEVGGWGWRYLWVRVSDCKSSSTKHDPTPSTYLCHFSPVICCG